MFGSVLYRVSRGKHVTKMRPHNWLITPMHYLWVIYETTNSIFVLIFFPASDTIMANFTQRILPSATDSKVASQSYNKSASVPLSLRPALSLVTSAAAVAELTSQVDSISSTSSTCLTQDASSSISESLTFPPWVSRFSFHKQTSKV